MSDKKRVFISYSRKDYWDYERNCVIPDNVVLQVKNALEAKGIDPWFDERCICHDTQIAKAIEVADVFLFISTENSNTSPWVRKELVLAVELRKSIIPLKVVERFPASVGIWIAGIDYEDYFHKTSVAISALVNKVIKELERIESETVRYCLRPEAEQVCHTEFDEELFSDSSEICLSSGDDVIKYLIEYIEKESHFLDSENSINPTYEPVISCSTSLKETELRNKIIAYEEIITHLTQEQERLNSFNYQIDELNKRKKEIEILLKTPLTNVEGVRRFLFSIIGRFTRIVGTHASSTYTSSDRAKEKLLECEKELEEKNAQAQICEKQIEGFIQQKNNLEKELAVLEEQYKYNEVYSSIFAPAEVKRKSHMQVQVYLHLFEETEKVKSLAQESDKNAERRDYIPLSLKLKKGDKVDVEFNVYGETRLMSERKSIIWQSSFTKCSFDYFVPKDIDVDELSCEANLFVNGAMIGEMRFITRIVNTPRNLNPEILSHRFNRIFISYAHQDAQQIKLLALAYKVQGVDYFYDRDSLAPGDVYEEKIYDYIDSSDLFVLCWSKNAAASDYVAKEKGRALLRAYPQLSQRDATLKICPISIEPRTDLPSDMKEVYNFEVI